MNQKKIFLEAEFENTPWVKKLSKSPTVTIAPAKASDYPQFKRGEMLITRHKGAFIKPCPATLNYNCCGLSIFHFGLGCTIGCRYCILETYLGTEAMVLFGNIDEGLGEIETILQQNPSERPKRFCTGEFTDSLLLDHKTGLSQRLIELFAQSQMAILELKTKTDHIDHLLSLPHKGRTVISFSVNAPEICRNEEKGAAPLMARLAAARRASAAGYPIGLHFDPIIEFPGWEGAYQQTVDLIGEYLPDAEVAWVSLGCFRYLPGLKSIMLSRQPETRIYDGEFVRGGDGKMRYPRPLRTQMYKFMVAALRAVLKPSAQLYMCMESPRVWRDVFGSDPKTEGLTSLLDNRAAALAGA
ncbi:MAG: radical SAM protein [Candidatus Adiutrix sp.]